MRRKFLLLLTFLCFVRFHTFAFLPWNRIVPKVTLNEKGQVVVSWGTQNPSARAVVVYAPDNGSHRQPFPDYFTRALDRATGKSHTVTLIDVKPNLLYNFRVVCVDSVNLAEIRSANYSFRLIKRGDGSQLGLVQTEGPLVANITTNSLVIAWKTNFESDGEVQYWEAKSKKPISVKTQTSGTSFELTVPKLNPDRQYFYRVRSTSAALGDTIESDLLNFRTAPAVNKPGSFKLVVYGDSRSGLEPDFDNRLNGVNYPVLNRLVNLAFQKDARFIMQTGDLFDGDTPDREDGALMYETHKKAIAQVNAFIPFYHSMGNHDARTPHIRLGRSGRYDPPSPNSAEELWSEMLVLPANGPEPEFGHPPFKENVYSFDYGQVHFIALNTDYFFVRHDTVKYKYDGYENRVGGRQLEWLLNDLKSSSRKMKVVYLHAAPYPAGGHKGSALDQFPAQRDSLWKIFEAYNVDIVFAGHEHNYSRVKVDKSINAQFRRSIFQITTGGAGAPTYAQDTTVTYLKNVVAFSRAYHYVLVTVEGRKIHVEAFDDNDRKFDEVTITASR
jgi:hypothetical protein